VTYEGRIARGTPPRRAILCPDPEPAQFTRRFDRATFRAYDSEEHILTAKKSLAHHRAGRGLGVTSPRPGLWRPASRCATVAIAARSRALGVNGQPSGGSNADVTRPQDGRQNRGCRREDSEKSTSGQTTRANFFEGLFEELRPNRSSIKLGTMPVRPDEKAPGLRSSVVSSWLRFAPTIS